MDHEATRSATSRSKTRSSMVDMTDPAARPRVRFYDDSFIDVHDFLFWRKEVRFLVPGCPKVKLEGALGNQSRTQEPPGLPSRS
jgi:hypothetical protein